MKKTNFHKVNEHVLIPILFILSTMSVIALVYFINEFFISEAYLRNFYLFGTMEIKEYQRLATIFIVALTVMLMLHGFVLKYRNWVFSSFVIIVNTLLILLCFKYA